MPSQLSDLPSAAFGEFMEARQAEHHVPGVAVGLLAAGTRHVFTAGITSLEHPLPVTPDTLFLFGSIGKTYTATLIMHLIEQGRLTLETRVRHIVPELRLADEAAAQELTIQHLLTHSGGWWEQSDEQTGDGDDALARFVEKLAEMPQIFRPGQHFSYSNSGFNLLGRVIEKVTGQSYEAALTSRVLEPLNLTETFFFPVDVMTRRFAVGHAEVEGEWRVVRPWTLPRAGNASGGLSASVQDLLSYAAFHLGQTGLDQPRSSPLTQESRQRMRTPHIAVDGHAHGLPWHVQRRGDVTIVSHNGGMPGQHAALWLIPELDVAAVILTNSDGGPALYDDLTGWLYRHWLGLPRPQAAPFTARVPLAEYAGVYRVPTTSEAYVVAEEGGHLQLSVQSDDESPTLLYQLDFTAPETALAANGPHPQLTGLPHFFLRGVTGEVEFMRVHGRVIPRETARK